MARLQSQIPSFVEGLGWFVCKHTSHRHENLKSYKFWDVVYIFSLLIHDLSPLKVNLQQDVEGTDLPEVLP
jgi:hypothetical protein